MPAIRHTAQDMPFVHITWLPKTCRTAATRKAVADAGHRVTFHAIPGMGHVIEPNEMAIVARMLQEFVRQHTPAKIDPHISFEEWQST